MRKIGSPIVTAQNNVSMLSSIRTEQRCDTAYLFVGDRVTKYPGRWVYGGPWERFGQYNHYVVVCDDGRVLLLPAHAGDIVPGSTEDFEFVLRRFDREAQRPPAPMTIELDPTYRCTSKDCGGRCFSAAYRALAPRATIPTQLMCELIHEFAADGGRVVRFDGGGDPLSHPAVRNGELPLLARQLELKTTILTSGDLLAEADLPRIGDADCYLRISLNAATEQMRRRFHGNRKSLRKIVDAIASFANWLVRNNPDLPIGVTFLLDASNYHEVLNCARMVRDIGVSHFSARRVLGPPSLRPLFSPAQLSYAEQLLAQVTELADERFRVFVPWRPLDETDLDPSMGDFQMTRCWQSTFKSVVEPDPDNGGLRVQLCGRYRGNGFGQLMQLPPLYSSHNARGWVERWQQSFTAYPLSRAVLPRTCVSCIDRGFILMTERILHFLESMTHDFRIFHLHLHAPNRNAERTWRFWG